MSYDLSDKTALVTGASRGIGAAIARSLANSGASVIAHYSSFEQGAVDNMIGIPDSNKSFIKQDLSKAGAGRNLWQQALNERPKIDIFINNKTNNSVYFEYMPLVGFEIESSFVSLKTSNLFISFLMIFENNLF